MVEVLYEDYEVVAINKPAGLLVHPDGVNTEATLVDWLVDKFPEIDQVGESLKLKSGEVINRPGVVHRLDKDTSGVMLIAKTQDSFTNLKNQFQNHQIQKLYIALVYGVFSEEKMRGTIDRPIGRSSRDFRRWSAQKGARGKLREAITKYEVISQKNDFALVSLQPLTGRTHQIRVHLKAIHHPVVCDSLYAPGKLCVGDISRQALHARKIQWSSTDGITKQVVSPVPADMRSAIEAVGLIADSVELW